MFVVAFFCVGAPGPGRREGVKRVPAEFRNLEIVAQLHAHAVQFQAILGLSDGRWGGQELELHVLFFGLFHFGVQSRHLSLGTAIDNGDRLGAQAHSGARRIDGGVAAAQHDHVVAQLRLLV